MAESRLTAFNGQQRSRADDKATRRSGLGVSAFAALATLALHVSAPSRDVLPPGAVWNLGSLLLIHPRSSRSCLRTCPSSTPARSEERKPSPRANGGRASAPPSTPRPRSASGLTHRDTPVLHVCALVRYSPRTLARQGAEAAAPPVLVRGLRPRRAPHKRQDKQRLASFSCGRSHDLPFEAGATGSERVFETLDGAQVTQILAAQVGLLENAQTTGGGARGGANLEREMR